MRVRCAEKESVRADTGRSRRGPLQPLRSNEKVHGDQGEVLGSCLDVERAGDRRIAHAAGTPGEEPRSAAQGSALWNRDARDAVSDTKANL
jgi:hypothetical protein